MMSVIKKVLGYVSFVLVALFFVVYAISGNYTSENGVHALTFSQEDVEVAITKTSEAASSAALTTWDAASSAASVTWDAGKSAYDSAAETVGDMIEDDAPVTDTVTE